MDGNPPPPPSVRLVRTYTRLPKLTTVPTLESIRAKAPPPHPIVLLLLLPSSASTQTSLRAPKRTCWQKMDDVLTTYGFESLGEFLSVLFHPPVRGRETPISILQHFPHPDRSPRSATPVPAYLPGQTRLVGDRIYYQVGKLARKSRTDTRSRRHLRATTNKRTNSKDVIEWEDVAFSVEELAALYRQEDKFLWYLTECFAASRKDGSKSALLVPSLRVATDTLAATLDCRLDCGFSLVKLTLIVSDSTARNVLNSLTGADLSALQEQFRLDSVPPLQSIGSSHEDASPASWYKRRAADGKQGVSGCISDFDKQMGIEPEKSDNLLSWNRGLVLGCDTDLLAHFDELAAHDCLPTLEDLLEQASIIRERYACQTAYKQSLDKLEQDGASSRTKFPGRFQADPQRLHPTLLLPSRRQTPICPGLDDIPDDAEPAPLGEDLEPSIGISTTPEPAEPTGKSQEEEGPKTHKETAGI
ncbi:hypothetical protein B0H14DRAFT_3131668 [Mycena olivaceomarginata]|nr:hypothetical protein B0H14DRAFT_3131668 [Mycena olivaceomarginata]